MFKAKSKVKKSYYEQLPSKKKEKAYYFLNQNFSNDELDTYNDEYFDDYLKKTKKEWDK